MEAFTHSFPPSVETPSASSHYKFALRGSAIPSAPEVGFKAVAATSRRPAGTTQSHIYTLGVVALAATVTSYFQVGRRRRGAKHGRRQAARIRKSYKSAHGEVAEAIPVTQVSISPSKHPTALDLISSQHPANWTKIVDLTDQLPESVQRFNEANPSTPITLLGKCEFTNPGMSHKDRIAKTMLENAEARGDLTAPDGSRKTILAASSGNTGCSLALVGTLMGYKVNIITNAKCSKEKCQHIRSNGAMLWFAESLIDQFPEVLGTEKDYMKQEDLLAEAFPDKFYSVNQYNNMDNKDAHRDTTGKEIFEQTEGKITHFVMAASTGGTIMGVGEFLKDRNPAIEIVLADPGKSHLAGLVLGRTDPVASAKILDQVDADIISTGGIQVEGAGKASLTGIMSKDGEVLSMVDYAISVNDFDAFDACRSVSAAGMLVGGSAGLNICAAKLVAERCAREAPREGGVTIVTLLCDHGIKYLSKIFNDEWLQKNDTRR